MREIKFRAWGGNRMIDPVWAWNPAQNHFEHYNEFHNNWMYGLRTENVILMQFTGLKDKNGKEIYEGDILKAPNGLSVISYDPPRFVASEEYDECFVGLADTWEIVGNVYENPELVKP